MDKGLAVRFELNDFDISETTGFLPVDPPLERLSGYCFSPWEDLMKDLPALVKEKRIREKILQLPSTEFSDKTLRSEAEWQRAYVMLCFLSQSYIWMEDQAGLPDTVPRILAVPWCTVSEHLKLPPVITYAAAVTYNYRLRDPDGPFDSENVYCPVTFTGTKDESWFYVIPLLVDLAGLPGLKAMVRVSSAIANNDSDALIRDFDVIQDSLKHMIATLKRMHERCDPKVFYTQVRPFEAGSKGLDAFPDGLKYEGMGDEKPRQYNGASAGQSSMIHSYDVFFGTQHHGDDDEFLKDMRTYMPPKHREFLEVLGRQPSAREYILKTQDPRLIQKFNTAIDAFVEFRSEHFNLVARYILQQKVEHSKNRALDEKGTGGTELRVFLKNVRDNTEALKIT